MKIKLKNLKCKRIKKMKKRFFFQKQKKGSMLVGALLALFMVAIISLAIIKRATIGLNISIDSGKSYQSYQESDKNAEEILTNIRKFDNSGFLKESAIIDIDEERFLFKEPYSIPENTNALDKLEFCDTKNKCQKAGSDGTFVDIDDNTKVSEVLRIIKEGKKSSSERAVSVPIPQRINNTVNDLEVFPCVKESSECPGFEDDYLLPCLVKISWKDEVSLSGEVFDDEDDERVEGYEMRRYAGDDSSVSCDLSQSSEKSGWFIIYPYTGSKSKSKSIKAFDWKSTNYEIKEEVVAGEKRKYFITVGGDTDNLKYAYTIKQKNKKNFWLDSLYYNGSGCENRTTKLGQGATGELGESCFFLMDGIGL
ncbi:MAG: hypothetical protein COZ85_00330 [Candidatus Moranbacteria bacterium CG_4_8_14_3_um_filter_34_16]|nr:MAG: hypothetical protein COT31_00855 [Candidatus Moranbacteria bacterium CG08_land_8_20_14_0_20_34_16]PIW95365.1 MAG: hypothetical protein COZ85_00330 [Candidatus Moranbacteria bacterium CG_4_8_14_3_um_filter_34_16]